MAGCRYWCDVDKKYQFKASQEGMRLLGELLTATETLLAINEEQMQCTASHGDGKTAVHDIKRTGYSIYRSKNSLVSQGVTWTDDEYSNDGLIHWYLRLKSLQRFTEGWAMLERSMCHGIFDNSVPSQGLVRIVSIGGGPGFELMAARHFFSSMPGLSKEVKTDLITMDRCESWRPFNESLGIRFEAWDICSEVSFWSALHLDPGSVDFILISNVMIYLPLATINTFHDLLTNGGVKAILINERRTNWGTEIKAFEGLGGKVIKLMERQSDHRQLVFCSSDFYDSLRHRQSETRDPVFPNQPFEDNKRGPAAGGLSQGRGWGGGEVKGGQGRSIPSGPRYQGSALNTARGGEATSPSSQRW